MYQCLVKGNIDRKPLFLQPNNYRAVLQVLPSASFNQFWDKLPGCRCQNQNILPSQVQKQGLFSHLHGGSWAKSFIWMGFSIRNQTFWGTPIYARVRSCHDLPCPFGKHVAEPVLWCQMTWALSRQWGSNELGQRNWRCPAETTRWESPGAPCSCVQIDSFNSELTHVEKAARKVRAHRSQSCR